MIIVGIIYILRFLSIYKNLVFNELIIIVESGFLMGVNAVLNFMEKQFIIVILIFVLCFRGSK